MSKIYLSLTPIKDAVWKTHTDSGAEFEIVPLPGDVDEQLMQQCSNFANQVDMNAFSQLVAPKIVRNWRGVGDKGVSAPCNPDTLKAFAKAHLRTIFPWLLLQARSIEHWRGEEIEAAKND